MKLLRRSKSDQKTAHVARWMRPVQVPDCPEGWQTGPPDFVGIGAQRSGTSWWYRGTLRSHPEVVRIAKPGKELHYFDRFWSGEVPDDFAETYHSLFPRPEGKITGEWTPRYILDFWAMRLLADAAPQAKLLVILRDPIERYRSGLEFEQRMTAEAGKDWELAKVSEAVFRGMYAHQLRHVFRLFDRSQVLVLQYEQCKAEPIPQMQRTHRFLGIEPLGEMPEKLEKRKRPPAEKRELPAAWREEIVARLRDDVADLAELCPEIDVSLWPDFAELAPARAAGAGEA